MPRMGRRLILWAAGCLAAVAIDSGVLASQPQSRPLGLDIYMPIPEDNPLTAERSELGRQLFFDPVLSEDRTVACATCHDPARAFTDGRATSVGVYQRTGSRSVPSLVNRGYGSAFFWDGRAPSLEAQVLQPIDNPRELGSSVQVAVARLSANAGYRAAFAAAFGRQINVPDLARALAGYVRTILSGDSRFDAHVYGAGDALTAEERLGLKLFRGRANCTACHIGPTFSDERLHNTGVAWRTGTLTDEGRAAVTANPKDRGAFKTPTLREIARTSPYMHDGSFDTLAAVIDFYNRGGHPNEHLDPELRPLGLSDADMRALEAFLRTLTGRIVEGAGRNP